MVSSNPAIRSASEAGTAAHDCVSTWRNTLPAAKTMLSGCRAGHGGDLREICAPPHALKSASNLLPGHITC